MLRREPQPQHADDSPQQQREQRAGTEGMRNAELAPQEESARPQREQRNELRHDHAGMIQARAAQRIGLSRGEAVGRGRNRRHHQQRAEAEHHEPDAQRAFVLPRTFFRAAKKRPQVAHAGLGAPVDGHAHRMEAAFAALLCLRQVGERTVAARLRAAPLGGEVLGAAHEVKGDRVEHPAGTAGTRPRSARAHGPRG
jgi:hypothetical protein